MSVSTFLRFVVTSKPKAQAAALHFAVQSKRPGIADFLHFALSITVGLAGALLTSFRCLGIGIDLDRGDGVMARVGQHEIGPQATVTISGSLNNVGRSMTFQRSGRDQSPFLSSFLRSPRRITATGYLGVPGDVQSRPLFDGYLLLGGFDAFPASASITAQDVSVKYSTLRLNFNLAPGSLRTRLSIILEILNASTVPYGAIDLGPDEGGVITKPISVGGDLLLDWLSRFLVPIGRKLYFRPDGKLEIFRPDTNGPVQRTLTATDIFSLKVTPPATNEANAVSFASTVFAYIGQSGTHTVVTDVATTGSYTPTAAINKQDHLAGGITPLALAPDPSAITKRVRTTTVFNGGTIVAQIVEEWGFYAPRACNKQQDGTGAVSWNASFDVYQFPDGTWRDQAVETFQKIRETRIQKTFDATSGMLTLERKEIDRYVPIELPITAFSATSVESSIAGFLTDDGRCWWAGREIVEFAKPDTSYESKSRFTNGTELTFTFYLQDGQGNISSTFARTYSVGNQDYWLTTKPTGSIPAGTYFGFGPKDAKRYTIFITNNVADQTAGFFQQVGPSVTTSFTQLNETSYKETISIGPANGATASIEAGRMEAWQVIPGSVTKSGHIPAIEILTAKQTPQATTQVVTDEVRKSLFGTVITDYQGNDFCETGGELQTAAFERLRELAAFRLDIEMPIDLSLQEGKTFGVSIPEITGDAKKSFVHDITMNFGPNGDGNQSVTALYYPPELAAA